mgnify:CR=1|jgi:hypothetical protein
MNIVTVNDRHYTVKNARLFVLKLELSRNAIIQWQDNGDCVITDNVNFDRPIVSLSSGHKTTIKD